MGNSPTRNTRFPVILNRQQVDGIHRAFSQVNGAQDEFNSGLKSLIESIFTEYKNNQFKNDVNLKLLKSFLRAKAISDQNGSFAKMFLGYRDQMFNTVKDIVSVLISDARNQTPSSLDDKVLQQLRTNEERFKYKVANATMQMATDIVKSIRNDAATEPSSADTEPHEDNDPLTDRLTRDDIYNLPQDQLDGFSKRVVDDVRSRIIKKFTQFNRLRDGIVRMGRGAQAFQTGYIGMENHVKTLSRMSHRLSGRLARMKKSNKLNSMTFFTRIPANFSDDDKKQVYELFRHITNFQARVLDRFYIKRINGHVMTVSKGWKDFGKLVLKWMRKKGLRFAKKLLGAVPIFGHPVLKVIQDIRKIIGRAGRNTTNATILFGSAGGQIVALLQLPKMIFGVLGSIYGAISNMFIFRMLGGVSRMVIGAASLVVSNVFAMAKGIARGIARKITHPSFIKTMALFLTTPQGKYMAGFISGVIYGKTKQIISKSRDKLDKFRKEITNAFPREKNSSISRLTEQVRDTIGELQGFIKTLDTYDVFDKISSSSSKIFEVLQGISEQFTVGKITKRASQYALGRVVGKYAPNLIRHIIKTSTINLPLFLAASGAAFMAYGMYKTGEVLDQMKERKDAADRGTFYADRMKQLSNISKSRGMGGGRDTKNILTGTAGKSLVLMSMENGGAMQDSAGQVVEMLKKKTRQERISKELEPFLDEQLSEMEREKDEIVHAPRMTVHAHGRQTAPDRTFDEQRTLSYKLECMNQNGNADVIRMLPKTIHNPLVYRMKLLGFRARVLREFRERLMKGEFTDAEEAKKAYRDRLRKAITITRDGVYSIKQDKEISETDLYTMDKSKGVTAQGTFEEGVVSTAHHYGLSKASSTDLSMKVGQDVKGAYGEKEMEGLVNATMGKHLGLDDAASSSQTAGTANNNAERNIMVNLYCDVPTKMDESSLSRFIPFDKFQQMLFSRRMLESLHRYLDQSFYADEVEPGSLDSMSSGRRRKAILDVFSAYFSEGGMDEKFIGIVQDAVTRMHNNGRFFVSLSTKKDKGQYARFTPMQNVRNRDDATYMHVVMPMNILEEYKTAADKGKKKDVSVFSDMGRMRGKNLWCRMARNVSTYPQYLDVKSNRVADYYIVELLDGLDILSQMEQRFIQMVIKPLIVVLNMRLDEDQASTQRFKNPMLGRLNDILQRGQDALQKMSHRAQSEAQRFVDKLVLTEEEKLSDKEETDRLIQEGQSLYLKLKTADQEYQKRKAKRSSAEKRRERMDKNGSQRLMNQAVRSNRLGFVGM